MNSSDMLKGKSVLITGGTGSLGKVLTRRLLGGRHGLPHKIVIFSRDEAKQHEMRLDHLHARTATDDIIYKHASDILRFVIGDIRDFASISAALRGIDVVFNAAALKQVPSCEYFPFEAVQTNVIGPQNIVRAIRDFGLAVQTVVGISTDKAVKPVNVMGMTKSLQERIIASGNIDCPDTRMVLVRYGNVLASRGSVIPLFHDQIRSGGPITITDPRMTRFLLSLEDAVDVIIAALQGGRPGETYVPIVPSANIVDLAEVLIGKRPIKVVTTGIRPGEKLHEVLISEEEVQRITKRGDYYAIAPILPELMSKGFEIFPRDREYSSADNVMTRDDLEKMLIARDLMVNESSMKLDGELLR